MSAQKITTSKSKLQTWADTRELDRKAAEVAKRLGIPLIEAYARIEKEWK